jgi:hypothetical protein
MLLDHLRQNGNGGVQRALHINIDHPVPFVDLELIDIRKRHQAGIVDKNVDRTMDLGQLIDSGFDCGRIDHVHFDHELHRPLVLPGNANGL